MQKVCFLHAKAHGKCTYSQAKNSIACCLERRMLCLVWLQPACAVTPESSIVTCVCCRPHACLPARGIQQPLRLTLCGLQTANDVIMQVMSEGAAFSELGKLLGCLCHGRSCASYLAGLSGDEVLMYANVGGPQTSYRISHP